MRTKCYSVRVESLISISEKAYKVVGFGGYEAIIPKSQVFGPDYKVTTSEAFWISAWILARKELVYSRKRVAWFDSNKKCSEYIVTRHIPARVAPEKNNKIEELKK